MAEVRFSVPGKPEPWRRSRTNGKRHFKDARTKANQGAWAWAALDALKGRPLLTGALVLEVTAKFPPPVRASRALRAAMLAGEVVPTARPDNDNIAKNMDALNGVVWVDDAQVADLHVFKRYSETPGVDVVIRPYVTVAA